MLPSCPIESQCIPELIASRRNSRLSLSFPRRSMTWLIIVELKVRPQSKESSESSAIAYFLDIHNMRGMNKTRANRAPFSRIFMNSFIISIVWLPGLIHWVVEHFRTEDESKISYQYLVNELHSRRTYGTLWVRLESNAMDSNEKKKSVCIVRSKFIVQTMPSVYLRLPIDCEESVV